PRKMLRHRRDAALREPLHQARAERADGGRIEMQRAVADHRAAAIVEVEHRREAEVEPVRAELGCDDVADGARHLAALLAVAVPEFAELSHRRDQREAFLEALHPAALVVYADRQLRLALFPYFFSQKNQLF